MHRLMLSSFLSPMMNRSQVHFVKGSLMVGDWITFVPAMRPFLQLKLMDGVSLKRETISLSDIELVTDKVIKVPHI